MKAFSGLSLVTFLFPSASCAFIQHGRPSYFKENLQATAQNIAIVAAATILSTAPLAANAADVAKGEAVFQTTCIVCHKGGTNAIAKERTLEKDALEKFIGLESEANISSFVKDSNVHRGALAFSARLSDEDYKDVAAFVYNQAMENKW